MTMVGRIFFAAFTICFINSGGSGIQSANRSREIRPKNPQFIRIVYLEFARMSMKLDALCRLNFFAKSLCEHGTAS